MISPENKLQHIIDFDWCKKVVQDAKAKGETYVLLCQHYSINIASNTCYAYGDPEDYSLIYLN